MWDGKAPRSAKGDVLASHVLQDSFTSGIMDLVRPGAVGACVPLPPSRTRARPYDDRDCVEQEIRLGEVVMSPDDVQKCGVSSS